MSEYKCKNRIDRIIDASLKDINEYLFKHKSAESARGSALAIITSYISAREDCLDTLHKTYGTDIGFAIVGCCEPFASMGNSVVIESEYDLMSMADNVSAVLLLTPKMSLLRRIACGEDDGMVENAVLRALLWGREVSVFLDFDKARCERKGMADWGEVLDKLTKMSIKLKPYRISEASEKMLILVTETEVVDASQRSISRICCDAGAMVTPLAWDKAAELGISIER